MSNRFQCTKETPWDGETKPVTHVDGYEVDDIDDVVAIMFCPNCGSRWKQEIPQ